MRRIQIRILACRTNDRFIRSLNVRTNVSWSDLQRFSHERIATEGAAEHREGVNYLCALLWLTVFIHLKTGIVIKLSVLKKVERLTILTNGSRPHH